MTSFCMNPRHLKTSVNTVPGVVVMSLNSSKAVRKSVDIGRVELQQTMHRVYSSIHWDLYYPKTTPRVIH